MADVSQQKIARGVARAKSQASFVIPPKRKQQTVDAATGETRLMEYYQMDAQQPLRRLLPEHSEKDVGVLSLLAPYVPSQGVLKCALAYFIASLFVYVPQIAELLGATDSKHIVCTVVVYFHAARTIGSMVQSLMFVAIALGFGISVSVITMKIAQLILSYDDDADVVSMLANPHLTIDALTDVETISIIFTLLVCSMALGTISFFKHRISKPTFNTACSLCAILTISCLIKEYSKIFMLNSKLEIPWGKISSSILCILVGCSISVIVCFTILRQIAKVDLINTLNEIEKDCGILLGQLSDSFMNDPSTLASDPEEELKFIENSRCQNSKLFNDLLSKLKKLDSSLEETLFETYPIGKEQECHLLTNLVVSEKRMVANLGSISRALEFKWDILHEYYSEMLDSNSVYDMTTHDFMNVINEGDHNGNSVSSDSLSDSEDDHEIGNDAVIEPQELFDLFFFHISPSTKSFVSTIKEILKDPLFNTETLKVKEIVSQFDVSLNTAKSLYQNDQLKAIDSLYKQDIFSKEYNFNGKVSHEEIAATCANFSFSLTQFSNELKKLLSTLEDLKHYQNSGKRSFKFLHFWDNTFRSNLPTEDLELAYTVFPQKQQLKTSTNYEIWEKTKFFRGVDFQFAFRVAMGALILGSLAFWPLTAHVFNEWRGEWVLVTFCIIMNKSLGGTIMTVKWRFFGTFLGAFGAYCVWQLFYPNMWLMAFIGFLVAIPCFRIIINWKANNAFGRFILLTYNLTVLYSYSMSLASNPDMDDDWEGENGNPIILEIAFHRYIGVSLGVIFAVIITLTLFPMSARARVKKGLTTIWLRMGLIWKSGPITTTASSNDENIIIMRGLKGLPGCHKIHSELLTLHKQAPMEIRLKGQYPTETYDRLIKYTGLIIDAMENMNSIIEFDPKLSDVELTILNDLKNEMKELENRVFLMFYMLSSAMTLKLPLMAKAAGTEHAMEKVVAKLADVRKLQQLQQSNKDEQVMSNEEFVLFFTYCLVTEAIVKQLNLMMVEVVGLFDKLDENLIELI